MHKKNILLTIALLATFLTISTLALFIAKKFIKPHMNSANNPDFFMADALYTKFNQQGLIRTKIQTNKITHFITNNIYYFDNPIITMHTPNEQPWHITANKGKSERGKSKIYLWDNVKIIRAASANNSDFDITTSSLTVYPETKFAKTLDPITIIQDGNVTKSIGAEADFKTGSIKLLSKIKGIYPAK